MTGLRGTDGFSELGQDIKRARLAKGLSRSRLAEMVNIVPRYLANIENSGSLPSLPVLHDLAVICSLPIEKYFFPESVAEQDPLRLRVQQKLKHCDARYLPLVEAVLDEALKLE